LHRDVDPRLRTVVHRREPSESHLRSLGMGFHAETFDGYLSLARNKRSTVRVE
jgi:hypothetical protein